MRYLTTFLVLVSICLFTPLLGADPVPGSGVPPAVGSPAPPTLPAGTPLPTAEQVFQEGHAAGQAVVDAAAAKGLNLLLVAGALMAVFKFLLDLLRVWGSALKHPQAVRIAVLALTLGVYLASNLAAGLPWWQSAILALSGPGAVAFNELWKLLLPAKWQPAEEVKAS